MKLPIEDGKIAINVVDKQSFLRNSIEYNCFTLKTGEIEHHRLATLSS